MHSKPISLVLLLALLLAAVSLACNIGGVAGMVDEARKEVCKPVSRQLYEDYCFTLGQSPKAPERPEVATYEACFINGDVTSVRIVEGYRPEETQAGGDTPASPAAADPSGSKPASTIPAGVYKGEFPWNGKSINTLVRNEINIVISPSGAVSGAAFFQQNRSEPRKNADGVQCTYYYEFADTYVISGQIAGWLEQPVSVTVTTFEIFDHSNCGKDTRRRDESCSCQAELTVRDGELLLTCGTGDPCGAYLTATK